MTGAARYAVYWAPEPEHALWQAGCEWLGRDPLHARIGAVQRQGVEEPRRYAFHATLKPPMELRDAATPDAFLAAVAALAARRPGFDMPPLIVGWLGDFMALLPAVAIDAEHPLRQLADACVQALDGWRQPPSEEELQRRMAHRHLDLQQQALLRRWGYPHVFDRWRFHMTLSNHLPDDPALRQRWTAQAARHFEDALKQPLRCESLCVFSEPSPGAPFELIRRFALGAASG